MVRELDWIWSWLVCVIESESEESTEKERLVKEGISCCQNTKFCKYFCWNCEMCIRVYLFFNLVLVVLDLEGKCL